MTVSHSTYPQPDIQPLFPEDLAELIELFGSNGLEFPFTPKNLFYRIRKIRPGVYAAGADVPSLYGLSTIAADWRGRFPGAMLAFGFDGYGLASNRLQCVVAGPSLAMAAEAPFGNYYGDPERELARARAMLAKMSRLYALSGGCREIPFRPGQRWTVVDSPGGVNYWTVTDADGATIAERQSPTSLDDVLEAASHKPEA